MIAHGHPHARIDRTRARRCERVHAASAPSAPTKISADQRRQRDRRQRDGQRRWRRRCWWRSSAAAPRRCAIARRAGTAGTAGRRGTDRPSRSARASPATARLVASVVIRAVERGFFGVGQAGRRHDRAPVRQIERDARFAQRRRIDAGDSRRRRDREHAQLTGGDLSGELRVAADRRRQLSAEHRGQRRAAAGRRRCS